MRPVSAERGSPLDLGTDTPWGKVAAVGSLKGERYYWLDKGDQARAPDGRKVPGTGTVSMMPAEVVERAVEG